MEITLCLNRVKLYSSCLGVCAALGTKSSTECHWGCHILDISLKSEIEELSRRKRQIDVFDARGLIPALPSARSVGC